MAEFSYIILQHALEPMVLDSKTISDQREIVIFTDEIEFDSQIADGIIRNHEKFTHLQSDFLLISGF